MTNKKSEREIWETLIFDVAHIASTRYEISNRGRVRSFNKVSNGKILKGSRVEGYKILKLRLFKPVDEERQKEVAELKADISRLYTKRRAFKRLNKPTIKIERISTSIKKREKSLHNLQKKNLENRTINIALLFHLMVAHHFLPAPKADETILAHLDYDKLNNRVENLKWMTPVEHQAHIRKSPAVIAEKLERKNTQRHRMRNKGHKLDSTQVLHIKKLLKRGWTLRRIAKQFKVSDMQIHRIKTGENWSHVKLPEDCAKKPTTDKRPKNIENLFKS